MIESIGGCDCRHHDFIVIASLADETPQRGGEDSRLHGVIDLAARDRNDRADLMKRHHVGDDEVEPLRDESPQEGVGSGSRRVGSRAGVERRRFYLPNRADGSPLAASPAAPSSGRPYASSIARRVPYRLPYVVRFPPPTDRLEMTTIGICPPAGEP